MEQNHSDYKEIEINNIDDLLWLIENTDMDMGEINELTIHCFGALFIFPHPKEEIQLILIQFWNKWNKKPEMPLFIDHDFY